jgi:hypothetical protein
MVTVAVTATSQAAHPGVATATPVGPIAVPPSPADTALPVISGIVQDGQTSPAAIGVDDASLRVIPDRAADDLRCGARWADPADDQRVVVRPEQRATDTHQEHRSQ